MKRFFLLIFVIFSLFFFVSCGGDENALQDEGGETDGEGASLSLRAVREGASGCSDSMGFDCLSQDIAAISFQVRSKGETVFQKSIPRNELKNLKEIKGIKDAENATLLVSIFLGSDVSSPKWQGKATGLKFEKGKTTKVTLLLYPLAGQPKELAMPEGLTIPRFGHSTTVLPDGRVLVAGGFTSCGANGKCIAMESVEIIDMESGEVKTLAPMAEKRAMHTVVTLNDGSVLFIGGVQALNAMQQTNDEKFAKFPILPYSQTGAVAAIEHYMPSYPRYNMKENNLGIQIANTTEIMPDEIPFMTLQSIFVKQTLSETGENDAPIEVFLVGGVDADGQPSKKTYKFTITDSTLDDGTVSIGTVTEFAESSAQMLLPALAYADGSIVAAGGRQVDSETAASIISETSSVDFGDAKDNIFFTQSIAADGNLYTFGCYELESGNIVESNKNKIRKWDISGKEISVANDTLMTRGNNIIFPEAVYDSQKDRFIIIGGTNAADIYQVINATDLDVYGNDISNSPSHVMTDSRIMPKAAVVPAGVIVDRPVLVITGGTSALNSSGSAAKTIKINVL